MIEAIHILTRTPISAIELNKAHLLLLSIVEEFEQIYGLENMVYNVHLLIHTATCVEKNGPLFCYSNYATEDYLGHLINMVHGNTDVLMQVSDRYLLQKNLDFHLNNSTRAEKYHEQIKHRQFKVITKLGDNLFLGKAQVVNQTFCNWIRNSLNLNNIEQICSYRAVFVNSKMYFESATVKTAQKRTCDSFVCVPSDDIFGEIQCILKINNELYFVVQKKYQAKLQAQDLNSFMIELEESPDNDRFLMHPNTVKMQSKYAFMKTDNMIVCSEFPNLYERN